jgi:hypothetical protein
MVVGDRGKRRAARGMAWGAASVSEGSPAWRNEERGKRPE